MTNIWQRIPGIKARLTLVAPVSSAAVAIVALFAAAPVGPFGNREFPMKQYPAAEIALIVSPLFFVLASALVLFRPRLGYATALFAGLIALSCLIWNELSDFAWANSWIALNVPDAFGPMGGRKYVMVAKLTILSVMLTVASVMLSALRLLPPAWTIRKSPVRERTWPAFGVSALALAVWFAYSVMPYRLPGMAHLGVGPDLRILHIEKRGLQFYETAVSVFKDGRFGIRHVNRRLFEYRFNGHGARGVMPETLKSRALTLARSLPKGARTLPAKVLRAWHADGWYILASGSLLTFTSEYRSEPPQEVVDIFNDIGKLQVTNGYQQDTGQDVCMGFCYGPVAALGFVYENHHCYTCEGATRCQ